MSHTRHLKVTSLLAREDGTRRHSIIFPALMAIASEVSWDLIEILGKRRLYWLQAALLWYEWYLRFQTGAATEVADLSPSTTWPPETATMPRLRGKSRRGAACYRAESRRKRLKQFEKALTLASIRRRKNPRVPPKAIDEHLIPEVAMQIHPPLVASEECRQWTKEHQGAHIVAEREESNYPPYIVKEEEPPDEAYYPHCIVEEEEPPAEPPAEATVQTEEKRTPPRPPGHSSAHTTKNPDARASNDKERMDHATFPELWHLPLVFELRSMLDDLAFRIAQMDQRMDMLFATFSKNAPKKQCPTCAQEYLIPVGWSRAGHKQARSSQQSCRSPG